MLDYDALESLLERIARVRLVVVGDVMLDHYVIGDAARLSPEAPVPIVRVTSDVERPGGAANTAVNVKALGAACEIVSVVGQDAHGAALSELLAKEGVGTAGFVTDARRPTTVKSRVVARRQQLVRLDREYDGDLDPQVVDDLLARYAGALAAADGVILSDYGKGTVTARVAAEVIKLAVDAQKTVTVDPKENHIALYRGVTSMTPNHFEAEAAAGIRPGDDPALDRTGAKLLSLLASESVLITCGERGMVLFHRDGRVDRIPTRAREVFDVAGAGDTVIATFTAALAAGADHLGAAQLANFAAGVVVGKVGTATATPAEILASIALFKEAR